MKWQLQFQLESRDNIPYGPISNDEFLKLATRTTK